jgi:adenine phosphoribosyltransferase
LDLKSKIREVEDFPIKGVSYKDISTLTSDKDAFKQVVDSMIEDLRDKEVDYIVGPEARGFLFGAAVAYGLGVGFVPIRKPGKLPGETTSHEYDLEYGSNTLEINTEAFKKGDKVAICDDLMATAGTVSAAIKLIESLGAEVVALEFVIELLALKGRDKLEGYHINSLVDYE